MSSIRRVLTSRLAWSQLAVLACTTAAVLPLAGGMLDETFDARLIDQARTLATLIEQRGSEVRLEFSDELMPQYAREEGPDYFSIEVPGEGVLERSVSLARRSASLEVERALGPEPETWDGPLLDGRVGRFAGLEIPVHEVRAAPGGEVPAPKAVRVVVATDRQPLTDRHRHLLVGLVALDLAMMALSVWLAASAVRAGLGTLAPLERTLAEVDHPSRASELASVETPVELAAVREALLAMMRRLDQAFERERRLAGNVAHELRTPIAELRAACDVALLDASDPAGLREAAEQGRAIAVEMERKVATILRVWARSGERERHAASAVDLGELVGARVRNVTRRAGERGLELRGSDGEPTVVECDARRLEMVLDVLLDNAVEHATPAEPITWSIVRTASGAGIEIRNAQSGLSPADAELVLEPFWSSAAARAGSRHCGLGLSLARSLCVPPELDLRIEIAPGRFVARVEVRDAARAAGRADGVPQVARTSPASTSA